MDRNDPGTAPQTHPIGNPTSRATLPATTEPGNEDGVEDMTTYLPTAPPSGVPKHRTGGGRALHPYTLAVGTVTAVQGVVIAAMALAGYFYLDDVDMTAEAAKHPFNWDYVTLALNDHLTPGLRTVYWLSAHFAPYDNDATVLGRVLVQALATLLMGYLLGQLFGPGRVALLGLGLYAFSPLLVPSLLSLSSGVNLLPTHVGILLLLIMHIRYEATREPRYAVFGALGVLLALLFWEKAALSVALPPLLTVLYLTSGGLRARLDALRRSWPAWLAYLIPVVGFFAYFVLGDYPKAGSSPKLTDAWDITWDAWLHSLGPTLVGGPWTWFTSDLVYYSAASPGPVATVAGQLAALVLTVLAIRRNGVPAVRAWLLPAVVLLGSAMLLAAGRFEYVGVILARNFHYFSELSIPLVLAVVLLLVVPDPAAVAARGRAGLWPAGTETAPAGDGGSYVVRRGSRQPATTTTTPAAAAPESHESSEPPESPATGPDRTEVTRPIGVGLALVVAAYALSYGTTVSAFERRWVENPIRDYLTTATKELQTTTTMGPIAVYDTNVPWNVATLLQINRRVSDIFRPVEPDLPAAIGWDDASRPLYMFDQGGHLVRARFVEEASSAEQPGVFCSHPLRGVGSVTVTLSARLTRPDSFVRLEYLTRAAVTVGVQLADGATTFPPRRNGHPTLAAGQYEAVLLGTPGKAFDRLVITSTDPEAIVCVSAKAGHPEPTL